MVATVPPELLRPYRVDWEHDVFSDTRKALGISYDDALDVNKPCSTDDSLADRTIFWPGCTFSSYSQELTDVVFEFLRERGWASKMSAHCCGHILEFVAPTEDRQIYQGALSEQLQDLGICRIITACPNCYYSFDRLIKAGTLPGVEIVALSEVLLSEGMRFSPQEHPECSSVCFHDSCPDRLYGRFAEPARALFEAAEVREMEHSCKSSRCCGLGYLLYLRKPERSAIMAQERIIEFLDTGADCLVTYCVNCASAFYDPNGTIPVYYYLELLFGVRIDWLSAFQAVADVRELLMAEDSH